MKRKMMIAAIGLAALLAIGIAAARSAGNSANLQAGFYAPGDGGQFAAETVGQWYCGGRGFVGGYLTPQLAALLKLPTEQIQAQLDSGKTLAEIAAAQGVSPDQLLQTMMGSYGDHLALMVKDAHLSQAQADAMALQAKTRLQTVITSNLGSTGGAQGGVGGMMKGWSGTPPQSGASRDPGNGYGMMGRGTGMMGRW